MQTRRIIWAGVGLLAAADLALLLAAARPPARPAARAAAAPAAARTDPARPGAGPAAPAGAAPAPAAAAVPAPAAAPAAEAAERARLSAENEQLRRHLADVLEWILANFRGRYPVPEPLMARLQLEAATADYELHPDVAALLRLRPDEVARVNEAFRYAHALVAISEERLVSIELTSADSAVVRIPPWPEAGEAIRSWLHATLDETLGADRSARLRTVSADSLGERFGHFGAGDRTIHFWLAPRGTGQVLRIRDEWRLPGASGEETQIRGTETAVADLPEAYLPYLSRIPRLGGGTR